jgi:subtilisin
MMRSAVARPDATASGMSPPTASGISRATDSGISRATASGISPTSATAANAPSRDVAQRAIARLTSALGIRPSHTYASALDGFAASLTPSQVARLRDDPQVAAIVEDVPTRVEAPADLQAGSVRTTRLPEQVIPTGVRRVNADQSPIAGIDGTDQPMDVDVAVIDTGIAPHPDLRIAGGHDCTSADPSAWRDRYGHGTHVAGTVAARDNGIGVVGVAPGARVWAVKVFNDEGRGFISDYVCGIDWVTGLRDEANPDLPQIEVVNMSFDSWLPNADDADCGGTSNDPVHVSVCALVAGGTTAVVAAGNDRKDARLRLPSAYDEAITVSALADFDGRPGGTGRQQDTCPGYSLDEDDSFANFSNFGADVDLMAPGKCILSTYTGGVYAWMSGTSMASPTVAGAAALVYAAHPDANPSLVRQALIEATNLDWATATDPDGNPDRLLDVSRLGPLPDLLIAVAQPADELAGGGMLQIPIDLTRSGGFTASVVLDTGALPENVEAEFAPPGTSSTATLTLRAVGPVVDASVPIAIRARGGGLSRSTSVDVTLRQGGTRMSIEAPTGPGTALSAADTVHVAIAQVGDGGGISSRVVQRQRADPRVPGSCTGAEWRDAGDPQTLAELDPAGSADAGWSFDVSGLKDNCVRWVVRLSFDAGASAAFDSGAVIVDTEAPPPPHVAATGDNAWQESGDQVVWARQGIGASVFLTITGTDPASGVGSTELTLPDGSGWQVVDVPTAGDPATVELRWSADAAPATLLEIRSIDATGHRGAPREVSLRVDGTPPTAPAWVWPPAGRTTVVDATPELLWRHGRDQGSGLAMRQLVLRERATIRTAGSCANLDWVKDGPRRLLDKHHVERDVASGFCYRYTLTALDEVGNRGARVRSGAILNDVTPPALDFLTPDEGTTTMARRRSIVVSWKELETGGSAGLRSRRLERERGRVVEPGTCQGVTWLVDGAVDSGTSPSAQSGLKRGYCYRWRLSVTDRNNMVGVAISGQILITP